MRRLYSIQIFRVAEDWNIKHPTSCFRKGGLLESIHMVMSFHGWIHLWHMVQVGLANCSSSVQTRLCTSSGCSMVAFRPSGSRRVESLGLAPRVFLKPSLCAADPVTKPSKEEMVGYLMQGVGKRPSQMFVDFSRAAPSLGEMSLWILVDSIDLHENFKYPDSLYYEISDGALNLHYSAPGDGWRVHLTTFSSLPSHEQTALRKALRCQIEEQRNVFPHREKIQAASRKHFGPFLNGIKEVADTIHKLQDTAAKKAEASFHAMKMVDYFNGFAQELKDQKLDALSLVLDSWKPLSLKRAIAFLDHLLEVSQDSQVVLDQVELPRALFHSAQKVIYRSALWFSEWQHRVFRPLPLNYGVRLLNSHSAQPTPAARKKIPTHHVLPAAAAVLATPVGQAAGAVSVLVPFGVSVILYTGQGGHMGIHGLVEWVLGGHSAELDRFFEGCLKVTKCLGTSWNR